MKNLIYLIDGTWLFAGDNRSTFEVSNVYKLNMLLDTADRNNNPQIIHYVRGLGGVQGLRRYTSGGFSYGINETIEDVYINICSNYEPGDKIYIFGFSRGAVIARAVTGLLSYGILQPDKIDYIRAVWDLFRLGQLSHTNQRTLDAISKAEGLLQGRCHVGVAPVEFLGVFETVVGGRGKFRDVQKLNLHKGFVAPCVSTAVQILALDETRGFFEPLPWNGKNEASTDVEQIWLPGVHSDVGGAYSDNFLGDVALSVMVDRILKATGLKVDTSRFAYLFQPRASNDLVVNSEYVDKFWELMSAFSRGVRRAGNFQQFLHPFALAFAKSQVRYKKNDLKQPYHVLPDFAPGCDYYRSDFFIGKNIEV